MAVRRKLSTAAAAMTLGSDAGASTVPESPLSPAETTTVTPAATAALSTDSKYVASAVPGTYGTPNDSEMACAFSCETALSTPETTCPRVCTDGSYGVSDRSTREAPGASPLLSNVQPAGI